LILRDHVGDENMDRAGGVLYELIEIDCDHTDDPGAAFQRWKHDHLRRHVSITPLTLCDGCVTFSVLTAWFRSTFYSLMCLT
jgi:hypothetical protein